MNSLKFQSEQNVFILDVIKLFVVLVILSGLSVLNMCDMLWVTGIPTSELHVARIHTLCTPVWVPYSGLVSNTGT